MRRRNSEEKFWKMLDKKPSGCWEWTGRTNPKGYGLWTWDWKEVRAHRLAWTFASKREIPEGMVIMHSCDNRLCCNPKHLVLGTVAENNWDMIEKGRHRGNIRVRDWVEQRSKDCPTASTYKENGSEESASKPLIC